MTVNEVSDRFTWKPGDIEWVDQPTRQTSAQKLATRIAADSNKDRGTSGGPAAGQQRR